MADVSYIGQAIHFMTVKQPEGAPVLKSCLYFSHHNLLQIVKLSRKPSLSVDNPYCPLVDSKRNVGPF